QTKSLKDLKNLADEATFYNKQWQASWQDQDSASARNIQCIGYERTALLEFKNDLIDGANRLVEWNSTNEDCCKWYGITCNNQTGQVSEMRLPGPVDMANFDTPEASIQRFRGTLNPSLQNLTSLSIVDFSFNNFSTNSIPSWITGLKSLVSLNLAFCEFNGLVPAGLMNMIFLATLDLSNNQLTGIETADSLGRLSSLEELDLSNNDTNGSLPQSIGQLTKLMNLNIEHNF
nr:leucine-rich repeat-containing protein [Tanacetum cinerariifolium]